MNRRHFLRNATGAAVVTAGAAWYSWHNGVLQASPGDAYAAWTAQLDGPEPGHLNLIRHAVLASSPHNTQPWYFRSGADFLELYLEPSRSVAGLDPYLREAYIGMGCALENLCLSAQAQGLRPRVSLPKGSLEDDHGPALRLVARVDFAPGEPNAGELYAAIPHRHTNRHPYNRAQPMPAGFVQHLAAACASDDVHLFLFEDPTQQKTLARISAAANLELYSDPAIEAGNQQWIRWRESDIQRYKDGLTIDNFGLTSAATCAAKLAPEFLLKKLAAPGERSKMYESQMLSASLVGILAVKDRMDAGLSMQAGRTWQRAHLLATARGLAARPCNEAVEMIDYERKTGRLPGRLTELLGVTAKAQWQPTFLFLMGAPTAEAHLSPRRPAEDVDLR